MGHYYYGKKYGEDITLPYFIPAPPILSIIGTFGAFIRIKSQIKSKKALFDIGIAGPIAGVIVAIPVIIIGLSLSQVVEVEQLNNNPGLLIITGDTLIFKALTLLALPNLPGGYEYLLHPMAFAGWVGLLVTALNLIPCGQLDGGHILYCLFSKKLHSYISKIMVAMLIILGVGTNEILLLADKYFSLLQIFPILANISFEGWLGWLIWAFLLTMLGTNHPPTLFDDLGVIDIKRKILALVAVIIFIGSFTPVPLIIQEVLP
jgi:membrane-associated protease RseP (regulator of RpoE activity)